METNTVAQMVLADEESFSTSANRIQPFSTTTPTRIRPREVDNDKKDKYSLTLGDRLGVNDLYSLDVWRASVGELLGTAVLVFMIDSIVISSIDSKIENPNLLFSILMGITLTILIIAVFPISGGHLNPVISFSASLVGLISLSRAFIYIFAQCVGALLGALLLQAVVSKDITKTFSLGGCTLTVIAPGPNGPVVSGIETSQAFYLEIICTFILLFASLWLAFDHRQAKALGHIVVISIVGTIAGLLVFVSTSLTGMKGYSGAGMNPARCLGPAIVRGGHLWNGHWVFWVGPTMACIVFYIYTKIIPSNLFHVNGFKHDFLDVLRAMVENNA
ncbi:LOW QUALITY PROTEIN: uncharacterized protein [Rutidosis leptorrhynchoides]|uniref:LOW QUALITY PROTEIN: uncharacterized protein n=1 Tax=Rutidosis leptorrhynchoides TaxID=125765 RepID=UPI003A9A6261